MTMAVADKGEAVPCGRAATSISSCARWANAPETRLLELFKPEELCDISAFHSIVDD
jgi:hypothetical protein